LLQVEPPLGKDAIRADHFLPPEDFRRQRVAVQEFICPLFNPRRPILLATETIGGHFYPCQGKNLLYCKKLALPQMLGDIAGRSMLGRAWVLPLLPFP
jgi:hypothetical protein